MKAKTIQYIGFFVLNLIEGLTGDDSVQWGTTRTPRPRNPPTKYTSCDQINNQLNLIDLILILRFI